MTEAQYKVLLAEMLGHWPRHPISEVSKAAWWELLKGEEFEDAVKALRAIAVDGKEFPPNGGQILRQIVDGRDVMPDWDIVVGAIRNKLRELNRDGRYTNGPLGVVWHTPLADEWPVPEVFELVERSGGIGAWAKSLGSWMPNGVDDTTFLAQQREIWRAMRSRAIEHGRQKALGSGAARELTAGEPSAIGDVLASVIPQEVAR